MTRLRRFTIKNFTDLANEVYALTGERVVVFHTTPKVVNYLTAEFSSIAHIGGIRRLEIGGIPVLAEPSISPDSVVALTRWLE